MRWLVRVRQLRIEYQQLESMRQEHFIQVKEFQTEISLFRREKQKKANKDIEKRRKIKYQNRQLKEKEKELGEKEWGLNRKELELQQSRTTPQITIFPTHTYLPYYGPSYHMPYYDPSYHTSGYNSEYNLDNQKTHNTSEYEDEGEKDKNYNEQPINTSEKNEATSESGSSPSQ